MVSRFYFAFGSNMNPARMNARGLPFRGYRRGRLEDFELVFNKRAHNKRGIAYANIRRRPGGAVEGVLYELESPAELTAMDRYEGTPYRYSREIFSVRTDEGTVPAWVYVANPAYIESELVVEENYLNHLLAAGELLSREYLEWLRGIEVLPAPSGAVADDEHGLRFNV